ncbi:AMP-binding enzyme [Luethyella okanaganae]|uniref:AMP-binding protein n=1 Tax=Luethyella okanaganae TaxID=69372 RepID=A0ABW1VBM0_9MICO
MGGWLGGADDDIAVAMTDHAIGYAELRSLVAELELPSEGVVEAHDPDPVRMLALVLASLARGRPVLVSNPDDPAVPPSELPVGAGLLLRTSGSSGLARTVARTAASWTASFVPFARITGVTSHDTVMPTGPLHVSMHLFAALHTLWLGGCVSDDVRRATVAHCTPTMLDRLLSSPGQLRRAVVAGAALSGRAAAAATTAGIDIVEYYGAAELSFVAADRDRGGLRAFPGVDVAVRDGTLWVRSPYLSLGYVDAAVSGPFRHDETGFSTVGDLAELDADGRIRIRGRGTAAITTAGTTIVSEDVERVLETLPGVRTAAVIGEAHPVLGESVLAVLELDDPSVDPRAAAREHLAAAELPRRWLVVDAVPRTESGKIAKGELTARLADGRLPSRRVGNGDVDG